MRLLFIGDVVARSGRRAVRRLLPGLRAELDVTLVVANGENAAGGVGLTPATADELFAAGVDALTTGNHVWDRPEIHELFDSDRAVLRPTNFPPPCPGRGELVVQAADGTRVGLVNVMGRVFMAPLDEPFRAVDRALDSLDAKLCIVDVHAEATSEKVAMGRYLDGRVSAVIGTHTHVATADERILPGGTAYQTDVGMTGPEESVIGVRTEAVVERFRTGRPSRFTAADGPSRLSALLVEIDPTDGRATAVRRISRLDAPDDDDATGARS